MNQEPHGVDSYKKLEAKNLMLLSLQGMFLVSIVTDNSKNIYG
jgi:hypothetical protein